MTNEALPPTNHNQPTDAQRDVWAEAYPRLCELPVAIDVHERASQVAAMTGKGLTTMFADVHRIVAPDISHVPTSSAMHIEGRNGENRRTLVDPSERQALTDHAAELIQALAARRVSAVDDAAFLKRAGHVAALAGVLAHEYVDGNGRTARTVAQLIRQGLDPDDPESVGDMQILSKHRPERGYKIYSYLPTHEGLHMSPSGLLDTAASLDIPLQDMAGYDAIKNSAFTAPFSD